MTSESSQARLEQVAAAVKDLTRSHNGIVNKMNALDEGISLAKHEHDKLVDQVSDLAIKVGKSSAKTTSLVTEVATLSDSFQALKELIETHVTKTMGSSAPGTGNRHTGSRQPQLPLNPPPASDLTMDDSHLMETFMASTETPRQSTSLIKPCPLPSFDGNPRKAHQWLEEYEIACSLNNWSSTEMIRGVSGCLTGDAKNWLRGRYMPLLSRTVPAEWSHFREEYCKTYFKKGDRLSLLREILSDNMKPSERLCAFFHRVVVNCRDYDPHMNEDDIVAHILKGIRPFYKPVLSSHLRLSGRTLNAVEEAIRSIEDNEDGSYARESNHAKNKGKRRVFPVDHRKSSQATENRSVGPSSSAHARANSQYVCYNCEAQGHRLRDCPQPKDVEKIRANYAKFKKQSRPKTVGLVECVSASSVELVTEVLVKPPTWTISSRDIQIGAVNGVAAIPLQHKVSKGNVTHNESRIRECPLTLAASGPFLMCTIEGHEYSAQVDTGASVSIMSEAVRKELNLTLTETSISNVKMANGSLDKPVGWVETSVSIGSFNSKVRFLILRNANNILLGNDFLSRHQATIDYLKQIVYIVEPGSPFISSAHDDTLYDDLGALLDDD